MSRSSYIPDRRAWQSPDLAGKRWDKRNVVSKQRVKDRYQAKAVIRAELAEIAAQEAEALKIANAREMLRLDRSLADAYRDRDYPYEWDTFDRDTDDYEYDEYLQRQYDDYLAGQGAYYDEYDYGCSCCNDYDYHNDQIDYTPDDTPAPPPPLALADPDLVERGRRAARRVRARRR